MDVLAVGFGLEVGARLELTLELRCDFEFEGVGPSLTFELKCLVEPERSPGDRGFDILSELSDLDERARLVGAGSSA